MKQFLLLLGCFLIVSCTNPYQTAENPAAAYQIIPQPTELAMASGQFLIEQNTHIICASNLIAEAEYLAKMLRSASGFDIDLQTEGNTSGTITLLLDSSIHQPEGYRLTVTYDAINITASTAAGIFYGIQTLRQLLPPEIESLDQPIANLIVPAVNILDSPRYAYRGMHLDVGRHFFPVESVKKYLDLIALHKMNTFHWHLTEDQGWRIEIKKYPRLTEIGSIRQGTAIGLALSLIHI